MSSAVTAVDREADWLALVTRAAGRAGIAQKALAADLEVDRAQLSRQLAGAPNHHLSFRRMWRLSPDFWRELVLLIIDFYGLALAGTEQDRRDQEAGRMLRELVARVHAR